MQHHPVNMGQRQFRIGDLADELKVKKFVIRFWEQEFGLSAERSEGGHRFYTTADLQIFQVIKDLLHNQGYTIEGARKKLPSLINQKQESVSEPVIEAPTEAKVEVTQEVTSPAGSLLAAAIAPETRELVAIAHINEKAAIRTCHHETHEPMSVAPCTTCHKHSRHLAMVKNELEELVKRLR